MLVPKEKVVAEAGVLVVRLKLGVANVVLGMEAGVEEIVLSTDEF